MRRLALLALAAACGGCGMMIDVGYLLDDGRYTRSVEQRRPTGEVRTQVEREVVVADEGKALRVVCEERTRSLDRVWQVEKTYRYRGGYHQAHWAAIVLEGAIAGGVAIGVTAKCTRPDSDLDCGILYWTIPFGVDVAYSAVRLLTIKKPKLVDKQYGQPYVQPSEEPLARTALACEPGTTLVVGLSAEDPLAVRVPVAGDGSVDAEGQQRALEAWAASPQVRPFAVGPDGKGAAASLDRCGYLRAHAAQLEGAAWTQVAQQCPAPQQTSR